MVVSGPNLDDVRTLSCGHVGVRHLSGAELEGGSWWRVQ